MPFSAVSQDQTAPGRAAERNERDRRLPLTPEQERELIGASNRGDSAASERLVEAFTPAIGRIAGLYRAFDRVEDSELRQEGVVGLLRALQRYDPDLGTPFWAYASWWVRQAMQQLVSEMTGPLVLSDRAARRLALLKRTRREQQQARSREPSVAELAEASELPRGQVEDLVAIERVPRGLDETLADSEGSTATLGDLLTDPVGEDEYERVIDRTTIDQLGGEIDQLDGRERSILFAHYGIGSPPRTLREIADGLELSVERVRQLEERALDSLRERCFS
jgi:RNA polymerase primary sigma factor